MPASRFGEYIGRRMPHSLANAIFMLRGLRGAYFRDGLLTTHDASFRRDQRFREAFRLACKTGSFGTWKPEWRTYVFCWAAARSMALSGDLVECGVYRGGYSRAVIHYVDLEKSQKKLWLLDTFDGLVNEQISPEERSRGIASGGNYAECYDDVCKTFAAFSNVKIIRGAVPDTLSQVAADAVSYLSLDMNCVAPELAAAEYFWPKLVSGAVMVLDDYGWKKYAAQREGFDEFAKRKGVSVFALPTGQGLIFKP